MALVDGGDLIVRAIKQEGVDTIFTLCAGHMQRRSMIGTSRYTATMWSGGSKMAIAIRAHALAPPAVITGTSEVQLSNNFVIRNSVFTKRTPRFRQSTPRFTQKEALLWLW